MQDIAAGKRFDERVIGEIWKTAFQIPQLLGYGDQWPLTAAEERTLTDRTIPMVARLSPRHMAFIERFADPVAFIAALAVIVGPRIQLTQAYLLELKIEHEKELRRAGLSRAVENTNHRRSENVPRPPGNPAGLIADGEGNIPGAHKLITDVYSQD